MDNNETCKFCLTTGLQWNKDFTRLLYSDGSPHICVEYSSPSARVNTQLKQLLGDNK